MAEPLLWSERAKDDKTAGAGPGLTESLAGSQDILTTWG